MNDITLIQNKIYEIRGQRVMLEFDGIIQPGRALTDSEIEVTAGDCKIDNAKYKAKFHAKARMLTPPEVEEHIGHAVGGVCPFGVNDGVAVYLDESLRRFGTVFPACGSSNSAIELTIEELERYSRCAEWVDVCKRIGQ